MPSRMLKSTNSIEERKRRRDITQETTMLNIENMVHKSSIHQNTVVNQ